MMIVCIVIFLLALVIPLSACVVLSLLHAFGQGLIPANWTLDNYTAVLTQGSDNLDALWRTLWLALGTATITAAVGFPVALFFSRYPIPGPRSLRPFTLR